MIWKPADGTDKDSLQSTPISLPTLFGVLFLLLLTYKVLCVAQILFSMDPTQEHS